MVKIIKITVISLLFQSCGTMYVTPCPMYDGNKVVINKGICAHWRI